ncbi:MAG: transcriptional regulator, TetR family [Acidimicrobiales bacterium]|nr:transcriptional regulator, TetR family [Acidimicrobiales bacterium]
MTVTSAPVEASAPAATVDVRDPAVERTEPVDRHLDAALTLVGRWGVTKTSLADVAKASGCSRATIYRAFPGGKQQLFHLLAVRELQSYVAEIVAVIDAAEDLEEALTAALVVASRLVRNHDAAQFILEHEPGLLLPFLGFHEVERVYRATAVVVGPHLERFLPADRAAWAAEWAARIFITYLFHPGDEGDLANLAQTRHLVRRFLLPAFSAVEPEPPRAASTPQPASPA